MLIVRAGLFTLCSSALLSLLPLLAKRELGLDSTGFGVLLGSFGMGAIIGGIIILPAIIGRFLLILVDPSQNENQALITIEYNKIDPKLSDEFEQSENELGRILKSEGMAYWELFQDPSDIGHYIEIRIADTWIDHIRQHEYVTKNVQAMEDRIRALIKDCPLPIISHYRGKSPLK